MEAHVAARVKYMPAVKKTGANVMRTGCLLATPALVQLRRHETY